MKQESLRDEYFEWLGSLVLRNHLDFIKYKVLLSYLFEREFTYTILMDENRYKNGLELRWHFSLDRYNGELSDDEIDGPCSVLEMMIALASRIAVTMDRPGQDDGTAVWFWEMLENLGLANMTNTRFNYMDADYIIDRLLAREYEPNGEGGLFMVNDPDVDMRNIELWNQASIFINEII